MVVCYDFDIVYGSRMHGAVNQKIPIMIILIISKHKPQQFWQKLFHNLPFFAFNILADEILPETENS